MTRSELIEQMALHHKGHLTVDDIEMAVKIIIDQMSNSLAKGGGIEIRGFGSFSLHYRPPRLGRNPKTGESVSLAGKYAPHFKPGKRLRDRVNGGRQREVGDARRMPAGSR